MLNAGRIRMAGIKGLQGVVRKTVNDELQANIWDPQHMDKIVPSLLFNLQCAEGTERLEPRTQNRVCVCVRGSTVSLSTSVFTLHNYSYKLHINYST